MWRSHVWLRAGEEDDLRHSLMVVFVAAFVVVMTNADKGQVCSDPPATEPVKRSKQAGAVCDATSRVWRGGSKQAYLDCMAAKGLGLQLTCLSQDRYCR